MKRAEKPEPGPKRRHLARACLFLFVIGLFLGLSGLLGRYGGHVAPRQIDLLGGISSPKLNSTSVKGIGSGEGAPVPACGTEPELATDTPALLAPPFLENGNGFVNSHRGDSPMMTNWKTISLPLILAGAFTASAGAQPEPAAKPVDLASLQKQMDEMNKTLGVLDQLKSSLLAIDKDVRDEIKNRHDAAAPMTTKLEQAQSDIAELRKQLTQIRLDIDALRNQPDTRIAAKMSPPVGLAHVRLSNTYFDPMRIVVNGKAYDVAPGETKYAEAIPAGNFTYEVLGVQAPVTRTLAANETFTVSVHP
jgi:hypothetical protein